jgi:hypothetical protein
LVKDVNDHLNSLGSEYKIDNILADKDSKFGKMIQKDFKKDITILQKE